jgi:peptide chain release factor 1
MQEFLRPRDPNDERDVIFEIRGAEGGQEANLWAAELMRMYMKYAELMGWKTEVLNTSETDLGGIKEVIFEIHGRGAYSKLKWEGGGHRVQRVPETETQGRIHTSAATVSVLPKAEEVDVQIKDEDLRIDVYRAGGHGGQGVNTTDSAVRLTHLPTGLVVTCQDERSQLKNKARAMEVLRSRLFDMELRKQHEEVGSLRRGQVGSGERGSKIRTYNFRENRVTDHRIGLTLYTLDRVLEGQLDPLIDALAEAERAEQPDEV